MQTLYDNLDFQRGVQAFLAALPAADLYAFRAGIRAFGPANQTVLISESLLESSTGFMGQGFPETVYTIGWLDTKDAH